MTVSWHNSGFKWFSWGFLWMIKDGLIVGKNTLQLASSFGPMVGLLQQAENKGRFLFSSVCIQNLTIAWPSNPSRRIPAGKIPIRPQTGLSIVSATLQATTSL